MRLLRSRDPEKTKRQRRESMARLRAKRPDSERKQIVLTIEPGWRRAALADGLSLQQWAQKKLENKC